MPCTCWWGLCMWRFGAVFLLVLSSVTAAYGQAAPSCSVETFEADAKQSLEACSRILKDRNPQGTERAEVLKLRARSFHRLRSFDAAAEDYNQALQLSPADAELHLRRGWVAVDQQKPELAFDKARRALELRPGYADVYHLIGLINASFYERYDDALAAYDEAVRLQPQEPLVRYNRQKLLEDQGRYTEALKEAELILALPVAAITRPASIRYYLRPTTHRILAAQKRADFLWALGRIAEARQAYEWAVQTDPDAQSYAGRASFNVFLARGDYASEAYRLAREDINRSIAIDPNLWRARDIQAQMFFHDGRYDDAEREFAKGIELYPINGTMRWFRATILRKLERVDEATTEAITAFDVDRGFMFLKLKMLHGRGYFPELRDDADIADAVSDAVAACMLDKECW